MGAGRHPACTQALDGGHCDAGGQGKAFPALQPDAPPALALASLHPDARHLRPVGGARIAPTSF